MQAKKHRKHRRKTPDESINSTNQTTGQTPVSQDLENPMSPPIRQTTAPSLHEKTGKGDELTMEEMMELANDNFSDRAIQIVRAANRHFISQLATSIQKFVADVEEKRRKEERESPFNITASLGQFGLGDDMSPSEPDDLLTKGFTGLSSGNGSSHDDTALNDSKERPMVSLGRTPSRSPSPSPKASQSPSPSPKSSPRNRQVTVLSDNEEEETMMFELESQSSPANVPSPEVKRTRKRRKRSHARSDKSDKSSAREQKKEEDAFTFSSGDEIEEL